MSQSIKLNNNTYIDSSSIYDSTNNHVCNWIDKDKFHSFIQNFSCDISTSARVVNDFTCPYTGFYIITCCTWNNGVSTVGCGMTTDTYFPTAKSYSYDSAQDGCTFCQYLTAGTMIHCYGQWVGTSSTYKPAMRICGLCIEM